MLRGRVTHKTHVPIFHVFPLAQERRDNARVAVKVLEISDGAANVRQLPHHFITRLHNTCVSLTFLFCRVCMTTRAKMHVKIEMREGVQKQKRQDNDQTMIPRESAGATR